MQGMMWASRILQQFAKKLNKKQEIWEDFDEKIYKKRGEGF